MVSHTSKDYKRVFLSSTYEDLKGYREVATKAIQRFGWLTVEMEDFLSQDQRPKELCLDTVEHCDIYVGLFAHRYGSIPEGDKQSITEQEYRRARSKGLKCLIFILEDDFPWLKVHIDRNESEKKLEELKDELKKNHTCSFFNTEDNLSALLSASLAKYTRSDLVQQLINQSQEVSRPSEDQAPNIELRVFRNPSDATDVRCSVINNSSFPTSVRIKLNAVVDGKQMTLPVPNHYAGTETWDLPAMTGYQGHFNMEYHILKPKGFVYSDLLDSQKPIEISIAYSAQTQSGKWHYLGRLKYRFNFSREDWDPII